MKPFETASLRRHILVCGNERRNSPLGPGCSAAGHAVYDACKALVAERGEVRTTWVTKTHCLGVCPKQGTAVAVYTSPGRFWAEVVPSEAAALLDQPSPPTDGVTAERSVRAAEPPRDDLSAFSRELEAIEDLARKKVLDLARRIKPGLTLEDIQNPHDFPELDDPDWHYLDGVLAGIQSVRTALEARLRSTDDKLTR